jgi:hypothetical protein
MHPHKEWYFGGNFSRRSKCDPTPRINEIHPVKYFVFEKETDWGVSVVERDRKKKEKKEQKRKEI